MAQNRTPMFSDSHRCHSRRDAPAIATKPATALPDLSIGPAGLRGDIKRLRRWRAVLVREDLATHEGWAVGETSPAAAATVSHFPLLRD